MNPGISTPTGLYLYKRIKNTMHKNTEMCSGKGTPLKIIRPATTEQYNQVRNIIYAFIDWHRKRHAGTTLTSDYYDNNEFEQEMASLPDKYGSGRNCILLACYNAQPAGCVALREIDSNACEMKRMFVYEQYHGKGVGRALAQALIKQAKNMGYGVMKLNTSIRQTEAQQLYENLGFIRTAPYNNMPKQLEDWLVFMELTL
jgi:GNAT superfamily N-acetyltransferase